MILDACGNVYDEIGPWKNINDCAKKIIEMQKHDKELGSEYGVWDYRIVYHEEDDDSDWQTVYKLYKYKGHYKIKVDERW